jgi:hypothetical protein
LIHFQPQERSICDLIGSDKFTNRNATRYPIKSMTEEKQSYSNVLSFLDKEFKKYEQSKILWELERAEFTVFTKLSILEKNYYFGTNVSNKRNHRRNAFEKD